MDRNPVKIYKEAKKEPTITRRTLVNEKHKESTQTGILSLFKEKWFCDVTLISNEDKTKVEAHKLVLCAKSEYFAAMFKSGLKESIENEVVLYNISGKNLSNLVNYCYTGKIECDIDTVESLIENANLMLLDDVIELCSQFLIGELSPINCLGFRFYAKYYEYKTLQEKAKEFTQVYFQEVIKQEEFFSLTLDELEEYLTDNELNVYSEKEVFKAIICWIKHKEEERLPSISKILHVLRSPLIEEEFIDFFFQMETEFDKKCCPLVKKTLQTVKPNTELRFNRTGNIILINERHIYSFDPINVTTNILYTFGERLIDTQRSTLLNEKLVSTYAFDEMIYVDIKTGKVHTLPIQGCEYVHINQIMACHGTIYSIFGINSFLRYDFDLKRWLTLESTERRVNATTVVLNDRIYVIGGVYDFGIYTNAVEYYDANYNKWVPVTSMYKKRASAFAIAYNNYIYVFGGRSGRYELQEETSIERYDPKSDTWLLFDAPFANQYLPPDTQACLYDDKIYFFCHNIDKQITVKVFDPETFFWGPLFSVYLHCVCCSSVTPRDLYAQEKRIKFLAYSVPKAVLP